MACVRAGLLGRVQRPLLPQRRAAPAPPRARAARCSSGRGARRRPLAVAPRAQALQARGRSFPAEHIAVRRVLGEGSYGQVFEVRGRRGRNPEALAGQGRRTARTSQAAGGQTRTHARPPPVPARTARGARRAPAPRPHARLTPPPHACAPHAQGLLDVGSGNERVVLKRVKARVHVSPLQTTRPGGRARGA
jgi:hypothetical protein